MNRGASRSPGVDPVVIRERISSLHKLVEELRQSAEHVTLSFESLGLSDLPLTSLDEVSELDFYSEVRRFEIFLIRNALRHAQGSQVKAARLLKMHETTLNTKLKNFNIDYREYAGTLEAQGG